MLSFVIYYEERNKLSVIGKDLTKQSDLCDNSLEYLDALYSFALVLSKNEQVASDLVQETYVHTLRSWEQFTPGTQLKSWMFIILRNIWINQYRRARRGPQFIPLEDEREAQKPVSSATSYDETPELLLLRSVEIEQVRKAIKDLPETYREVILLREMEGFSYREISTILQCAEGTVMSRLNRARQQLRSILSGVLK